MKKIVLTTLLTLFSGSLFASNEDYDFSNIRAALHTYLKQDMEHSRAMPNSSLSEYYYLTSYAVSEVIRTQGWEIDHVCNYDMFGNEIKASYHFFTTDIWGNKIYIPSNAYIFISKPNSANGGKEGHLIVVVGRDGIFVYTHDSDLNQQQEFFKEFETYLTEKNVYNKSVLEIGLYEDGYTPVVKFMQNVTDQDSTWGDLILSPTLKNLSFDLTEGYLLRTSLHKAANVKTKKGILLAGPPGTGKSFLGQILATSILKGDLKTKSTMFIVTARHLNNIHNISMLYRNARLLHPTAIFMEDIDLLGVKNRESQNGGFESESRLNEMLNGIDGLIESNYVLTIGTTNRIDYVDPALSRSLRLGQHIYYGLPTMEERRTFFNRFGKKSAIWGEGVDDIWLASRTENLSGSDIIEIIRFAKRNAYLAKSWQDGKLLVTQEHFLKAIELLKNDHEAEGVAPTALAKKVRSIDIGQALKRLRAFEQEIRQ